MSVAIYGRKSFGRVHAHDGEFADTQFVHVNLVPLIPLRSVWVTLDAGNTERLGFPIKVHLWSVVAAYLRVWAPVVALIVFVASGATAALAAAGGLVALSAWSWTWRSRRGELARRRSDFDRVALGSRCDPAWMTAALRDKLARGLTAQLSKRDDARPPDDVARFGARDLDEAVLAYGLLRVAGARSGAARAAADRLLSSSFETLPSEGGPYREQVASSVPELGAAISAAARAHAEAARLRARAARIELAPSWYERPWVQLIGLATLTVIASAMVVIRVVGLVLPRVVDDQALLRDPSVDRFVTVRCDRVPDEGWDVLNGSKLVKRLTLCECGGHTLPVLSVADEPIDGATLLGELRELPRHGSPKEPWVGLLRGNAELKHRLYGVYLYRNPLDRRFSAAFAVLLTAGAAVGWVLWLRAFRSRRRARVTASPG
jgi:hypothetical protein